MDIESLSENKAETEFRQKFIKIIALVSIIFVICIFGNRFSSIKSVTSFELTRKGLQEILPDCVNLYSENPHLFPDTASFTVCSNEVAHSIEVKSFGIDNNVFSISYIETGDNIFLAVYDKENFEGKSLIISPRSKIDFEKHAIHNAWDNIIRSISLRTVHKGEGGVFKLSHRLQSDQVTPGCVAVYYSLTDGFYLCGDPKRKKEWKFFDRDLIDQGFMINDPSIQVISAVSGPNTILYIFDGPNLKNVHSSSLKIVKHQSLNLGSVKYGWASHSDNTTVPESWIGKPKSFFLNVLAE